MDVNPEELSVYHNTGAQRYEIQIGDYTAVLVYDRDGSQIAYLHTVVPYELEGQGLGSKLARAALDDAREHGLTVIPHCPFVRSYLQRHPQDQDLVLEGFKL